MTDEGLRERKKRETRQRISDVATVMFLTRGYDVVTIAEIADEVGVSEKTVYNYFPTKEGLVFDLAEEQHRDLTKAVREREPGTSPVAAFVSALKEPLLAIADSTNEDPAAVIEGMASFGEMVRSTPALQAAWGEHRVRLVDSLTQILAANYRIDPREAELLMAARATVSLLELCLDSQLRHVEDGLAGRELVDAVEDDLDRGARLIETGLLSLNSLVEERRDGKTRKDQERSAEQAREQVIATLREARTQWREFSEDAIAAGRELKQRAMATEDGDFSYIRELARQRAQELKARAQDLARAQKQATQEAAQEVHRREREAHQFQRDAKRSFRRSA